MTAIETARVNEEGTNRRPRIQELRKKFQWNCQSTQRLILPMCFDESLVLYYLHRLHAELLRLGDIKTTLLWQFD